MNGQAQHDWDDVGLVKVVTALLLAPLAWFLDLQVSYAMVKWACRHDRREVLVLFSAGSLCLLAFAGWMSWSSWTQLRGARTEGATREDRSYFLAIAGLALTGIFTLLVLSSVVFRVMSPCN